jgi:hypothetical protein
MVALPYQMNRLMLRLCLQMSRTHRKRPYGYPHRNPKTFNELKQVRVTNDYYDSEYQISTRKRYIPTSWDDLLASSYLQTDFKV